jgi:hypothetical protein
MRIETVTRKLYQFDELDSDAKNAAREWWRAGGLDYEWWDCVCDNAKTIAGLMGIDPIEIQFSGFWSQGDGASFTGDYEYKAGSVAAVRDYAPRDSVLHAIAESLARVQRRNFYQLSANVTRRTNHYVHENTVSVDVTRGVRGGYDYYIPANDDASEAITEALRDFMRWIYRQLESEYEYINSDESVDESILCNEYEFTVDGSRA